MLEINEASFDNEVLNNKELVLVDFWSSWCNPCKQLMTLLSEISQEFDGRVKFVKVNVEDNIALAQKFNIRSLPTVIAFNKGDIKDIMIGFKSKEKVIEFIEKNL